MNAHAMPDQEPEFHPDEQPFAMDPIEARIADLAKLSPLDYERCRESEAEALGLRKPILDQLVEAARPRKIGDEAADPFEDVEPATSPVDGAALMDDLGATILRFCVLPEHSAPLMAAWVLHAWAHDAADISPVLALTSPEKRCGKTTAVSVISALVPRAMHAINISTSVLFRVIEKYAPTVLIDEADTFLGDDQNSDMRGILNGGHNRLSAYVWRSVGDDHEPRRFKVWAPKVIAMIGSLPDTLEDRALVVRLRRKREGESVERFRADRVNDFLPLRQRAARWAKDNALILRDADPAVPPSLNDRAQDNARAICAISDAAGGHWPETIRRALIGMHRATEVEAPQSAGVLLLRDLAQIFASRKGERIGSTELCEAICALEESPWGEWRGGRPISTRGIAKLLKPYGIGPAQDRYGSFYRPTDFADAFDRYLSQGGGKSATSTSSTTKEGTATEKHHENNAVGVCGAYGPSLEGGRRTQSNGPWGEGEL
jgi:putative DNA primase/helicase